MGFWALAALNNIVICIIAARTAQVGSIPANLFCIATYAYNIRAWRNAQSGRL